MSATMTRLTKKQEKAQVCRDAIEHLQKVLKPGDTVKTVLKKCSSSGMSRRIALVFQDENISGWVAQATDRTWADDGSVKIGGCGMDMGFALVYELSAVLFPLFECIGEQCPSNDHSNGDRDYTPHLHSDGGYALRQRWL